MKPEARVLISIGCNSYDYQPPLEGAIRDASRLFDALINNRVGEYDLSKSVLLESPTLNQIRAVFRNKELFSAEIDVLTFFFAGHGGVKSGKFYICAKDTDSNLMSSTGFSMSELFQIILELAPRQTNVILDACESGGLIQDIRSILDPQFMGNAGTPGLTIFATSAQDQLSGETEAGGFGTVALIECIEGKHYIQDSLPALDLMEIGRFVSDLLAQQTNQLPVVWGLNLNGPSGFCHNPFYSTSHELSLKLLKNNLSFMETEVVRRASAQLWKSYESVITSLDSVTLAETLVQIFEASNGDVDVLQSMIRRVRASLVGRATESTDPFRVVEVEAIIATALIIVVAVPQISQIIDEIVNSIIKNVNKACCGLIERLHQSEYEILSKFAGLADLFYLPLRLSKILGWAAAVCLFAKQDPDREQANHNLKRLSEFFVSKYPNSLTAMSDLQAPFIAVTISQMVRLDLVDHAEIITSLLFSTFSHVSGKVARCDISPDDVLTYLIARQSGDFEQCSTLVAQPNLTLTVLLKLSRIVGLEQIFDFDLSNLDGQTFTAYKNDDIHQYARFRMRGGSNSVWQIGFDVFRVSDIGSVSSSLDFSIPGFQNAYVLSSLVLPNRVCWHLIEPSTKG